MNKVPIIAGLIVLVLVAGGAFVLTSNSNGDDRTNTTSSRSTHEENTATSTESSNTDTDDSNVAAVITYDGTSFSPDKVTVKSGDKVTVKNISSNAQLEFASDPHPTHTDNTDLNAGDEDPGKSKTFTVTKKGTFGFHNHYNQSHRGQITIK